MATTQYLKPVIRQFENFDCFLRFAWEAKTNSRSARHATLLRDDTKRMLLKGWNEERGTRNEERGTGNSERENEKREII